MILFEKNKKNLVKARRWGHFKWVAGVRFQERRAGEDNDSIPGSKVTIYDYGDR